MVRLCVIQPAVSLLAFVPLSRWSERRVKWRGGELVAAGEKVTKGMLLERRAK